MFGKKAAANRKIEVECVCQLPQRHCEAAPSGQLEEALLTCARFALQRVLQNCDPRGRIPIEDCELGTFVEVPEIGTGVTLTIKVPKARRDELVAAADEAWKELIGNIDIGGMPELIRVGREIYG